MPQTFRNVNLTRINSQIMQSHICKLNRIHNRWILQPKPKILHMISNIYICQHIKKIFHHTHLPNKPLLQLNSHRHPLGLQLPIFLTSFPFCFELRNNLGNLVWKHSPLTQQSCQNRVCPSFLIFHSNMLSNHPSLLPPHTNFKSLHQIITPQLNPTHPL